MAGFDGVYERFQEMEQEIEELKDLLDEQEYEIDEDDPLINIADQLGVIAVPHMPRWALLLDIERAIENVKDLGY